MTHFSHWSKKSMALILATLTLFQAFMPLEIIYAANNDPSKFILNLENYWGGTLNNRQANLIFRTLHLFPPGIFHSLKDITYNLRHTKGARGKANGTKIILNTSQVSDPEMLAVFIHELGHVYDLGTAVGTEASRNSAFKMHHTGEFVKQDDPSNQFYGVSWASTKRKSLDSKISDFVSGYAQSIPMEDFAESFVFYVLHGREFALRAQRNQALKQKFDHIAEVVFNGEFFDIGSSKSYPLIFFDVTKLSYTFAKLLVEADKKRLYAESETKRARRRTRKGRTSLARRALTRLRVVAGR